MTINLINYALAKKDWEKAYEDLKVLGAGGRNLEPDSHFDGGSRNGWGHIGYFYITVENSIAIFECIQTHGASRLEKVFSDLKVGELYTLTIYADLPKNIEWGGFVNATVKSNATLTATPGQFKTYSVTFEATGSDVTVRGYMPNLDIGTKAYIDWYKLEKGDKATDWTPAPEDINAHPFVAELAETVFRSKQNEERIRNLENALTALGGGS